MDENCSSQLHCQLWRTHRAPSERKLDGVEVSNGAPDLCDQTLLGHVDVAQVQGVVNGLHLPHFDEPDSDVLSSCLQDPLAVILCLIENLMGEKAARRDPSTPGLGLSI